MFWLAITIALIIIIIALSFYLLMRPSKYWSNKGVKQGNPLPIFGDSWGNAVQKQSLADLVQMVYNFAPDSRYCGMYQFLMPVLVIREPDLIKQMTVKDFDHFLNHTTFVEADVDPLWCKNLFALKDQKWREMRATLSPAFTSSKMKFMFSLIKQSGEQFAQHFLKQKQKIVTVEMKDAFTRFTNDVIANTAFGLKCDSLEERDNEFYTMGKEATDTTSIWKNIKFFLYLILPKLSKVLGLPLFSKEISQYFIQIVKDNIANREKHGIVRPDMIHLLMEARKNDQKNEENQKNEDIPETGFATVKESENKIPVVVKEQLTDVDITAQALIFFFAGFDSVSSLMCFMSYELGINPDIQERLRNEVDETAESCNNDPSYEVLMGMKYMDMVMSETLRMWPAAAITDRTCTKPYTIEPLTPDERPVHLKEGDVFWLPIYAIQRDPKYFPDPDRFDPERFSEENRANIKPYSYIPFGSGPRNCIGSRFALLETKILFYYLLLHFEIVPVEKTKVPLQLSKKTFSMTAEDGFWFGLKRRVK